MPLQRADIILALRRRKLLEPQGPSWEVTHVLTVGNDNDTRYGFNSGVAGALDPVTHEGFNVADFYTIQSSNILTLGKQGGTKWSASNTMTVYFEGSPAERYDLTWDFIDYKVTDAELHTWMVTQVGNDINVRIFTGTE